MVVLLRALANVQDDNEEEGDAVIERVDRKKRVPAIVQLEKAARREAKSNVDVDDIATRLPPGLETPTYEVIKRTKKTGYEIRCYQPFSICSVSMNKPRPDEKSLTDAKISLCLNLLQVSDIDTRITELKEALSKREVTSSSGMRR